MSTYLTTGQVARKLRVSVSTLKRWIVDPEVQIAERRNCNGWRLFSDRDIDILKKHKRMLKRNGKRFNETTLIPIMSSAAEEQRISQTA